MLAASEFGLRWVIFDAKEFLNADIMMASLAVIGGIGYAFERLAFGSVEPSPCCDGAWYRRRRVSLPAGRLPSIAQPCGA